MTNARPQAAIADQTSIGRATDMKEGTSQTLRDALRASGSTDLLTQEAKERLLNDGFIHLRSAVPEATSKQAMQQIWHFLQDVSNGHLDWDELVKRASSMNATNDSDALDPAVMNLRSVVRKHQFGAHYGAGWLLNSLRQNLADEVFQHLWGTSELLSSKEGFRVVGDEDPSIGTCFEASATATPTTSAIRTSIAVRSLAILPDLCDAYHTINAEKSTAQTESQGTRSSSIVASIKPTVDAGGDDSDTVKIRNVPLSPGDVLLYRSDMTCMLQYNHNSGAEQQQEEDQSRYNGIGANLCHHVVFDCTMVPSRWFADEKRKFWNEKLDSYNQRRTAAWCVDRELCHQPTATEGTLLNAEGPHRKILLFRNYFRRCTPILSERMAQLYGLVPYHASEKELEKALIRGVRLEKDFSDVIATDPAMILSSTLQSVSAASIPAPAPICTRTCACTDSIPNVPPSIPAKAVQLTTDNQKEMVGQEKYLGGMSSPCGRYVYGVPGGAKRVLRITTETGRMDWIGPTFVGKFKWLRGVEVPPHVFAGTPKADEYSDGCCIALACNDLSFLKVNPAKGTGDHCDGDDGVYTFGRNVLKEACEGVDAWFYHGGNLAAQNGWIYCIPANAPRIAKINPVTDEVVMIGPDLGNGRCKWFGGIVGSDGNIYGIPHNEHTVLRINPQTDEVSFLGSSDDQRPLPVGQWKWHGGLAAGDKIIGFPNNSDEVLVINCKLNKVYTVGSSNILFSGRHRIPQDNRYKYLGGALTRDGKFAYLFPCDAERVLRMNMTTDELELVGPPLLDGANKFQNGFCCEDGCLYGIPQRATGVLRIHPSPDGLASHDAVDVIPCGEDMMKVKDKCEGGVLGMDGAIYCIPLRAKTCIKIVPCR